MKEQRQPRVSLWVSGSQLGLSPGPTLASFCSRHGTVSSPAGGAQWEEILVKETKPWSLLHARKGCSREEPPVDSPCQGVESLAIPEQAWLMGWLLWLPSVEGNPSRMSPQVAQPRLCCCGRRCSILTKVGSLWPWQKLAGSSSPYSAGRTCENHNILCVVSFDGSTRKLTLFCLGKLQIKGIKAGAFTAFVFTVAEIALALLVQFITSVEITCVWR